ncbi:ABC transporter ATP-binding protein [Paenibacillus thiaminolyticus]|uniref:ABC transporter ATP-binding protein n=1 Tax=Paenibacillus thiaminolyticus TaxID=49283 RepID=UPI00232DE2B1|nr:ABC transporter ATP-binding protein [Paenibacillus thiaminolyticus]WCF10930.1 ABC transporter ATP-binding protein [Paenibacillus thiaminolyticus]
MLLNVQNLTKVFSGKKSTKTVANDNLSFSVREGEIYGLLGHNGAGKTTLVNQIIGLMKPTSGEISLLGRSIIEDPSFARSMCSVQPQSQLPLGYLTPVQAVSIMGKMRSGDKQEVNKRMNMLFEALDIGEWVTKEGVHLSGGVRRLVAFCMAVVVPGKLVILDEPTNDVDPIRRRYLWELIRKLTVDGTSVILVTHNVIEAEKAVDRVAILNKGKFLAEGTPAEVKSSVSNLIRVEVSHVTSVQQMQAPVWALSTHSQASRSVFSVKPDSVPDVIEWARNKVDEGEIMDYSLSPTTLEDVYVELTSKGEIGA